MNAFKIFHRLISSLLLVALILGLFARLYMFPSHFTHIDDIGIAINMTWYDSLLQRFLSFREWTYAPLQYIFEAPLISLANSYKSYIILGRLPSFVLGLLNIFLCHRLLQRVFNKTELTVFGDVFILLSWENIIYGSQMQPYLIALTFIFLQIYVLHEWEAGKIPQKNLLIYTTIVGTLSCYAQYQLLLFTFSFYIALLIYHLKIREFKITGSIIIVSVTTLLLCIPVFYIIIKYDLSGRGLNWNTGINDMFLFNISNQDNLIDTIKYIVSFLSFNFFVITKYFFTSDVRIVSDIITLFLIISSIYGLYKINILKNNSYYLLGIYFDIVIVLYLFMVLKGSLPLGPSRHNLVLFPMIFFISIYGVYKMPNLKLFKLIKLPYILALFVVLNICTYACVMLDEMQARSNRLSEDKIISLVSKYEPNAILGLDGMQYDLQLMEIPLYKQKSKWMSYGLFQKEKPKTIGNTVKILILSENKLDANHLRESVCTYLYNGDRNHCNHKMMTLYKEEYVTSTIIEYASDFFENRYNGLCLYVIGIKS